MSGVGENDYRLGDEENQKQSILKGLKKIFTLDVLKKLKSGYEISSFIDGAYLWRCDPSSHSNHLCLSFLHKSLPKQEYRDYIGSSHFRIDGLGAPCMFAISRDDFIEEFADVLIAFQQYVGLRIKFDIEQIKIVKTSMVQRHQELASLFDKRENRERDAATSGNILSEDQLMVEIGRIGLMSGFEEKYMGLFAEQMNRAGFTFNHVDKFKALLLKKYSTKNMPTINNIMDLMDDVRIVLE